MGRWHDSLLRVHIGPEHSFRRAVPTVRQGGRRNSWARVRHAADWPVSDGKGHLLRLLHADDQPYHPAQGWFGAVLSRWERPRYRGVLCLPVHREAGAKRSCLCSAVIKAVLVPPAGGPGGGPGGLGGAGGPRKRELTASAPR